MQYLKDMIELKMIKILHIETSKPKRIKKLKEIFDKPKFNSRIIYEYEYSEELKPDDYFFVFLHASDAEGPIENKFSGKTNMIIYSGGIRFLPKLKDKSGYKYIECNDQDFVEGIEKFMEFYFKEEKIEIKLLRSKSLYNKRLHVIRHDFLNSLTSISYNIDSLLKYLGTKNEIEYFESLKACYLLNRKELNEGKSDKFIAKFVELYSQIVNKDQLSLDKMKRDIKNKYSEIFSDFLLDLNSSLIKEDLRDLKYKIKDFANYIGKFISEADGSVG